LSEPLALRDGKGKHRGRRSGLRHENQRKIEEEMTVFRARSCGENDAGAGPFVGCPRVCCAPNGSLCRGNPELGAAVPVKTSRAGGCDAANTVRWRQRSRALKLQNASDGSPNNPQMRTPDPTYNCEDSLFQLSCRQRPCKRPRDHRRTARTALKRTRDAMGAPLYSLQMYGTGPAQARACR
jgi:hypothetical protein